MNAGTLHNPKFLSIAPPPSRTRSNQSHLTREGTLRTAQFMRNACEESTGSTEGVPRHQVIDCKLRCNRNFPFLGRFTQLQGA